MPHELAEQKGFRDEAVIQPDRSSFPVAVAGRSRVGCNILPAAHAADDIVRHALQHTVTEFLNVDLDIRAKTDDLDAW